MNEQEGGKPTFDLRLKQWIRCELAARKIQRSYRQWKQYSATHRRIKLNSLKYLNRSYDFTRLHGKVDESRSTLENFPLALQQRAGFDVKCAIWRRVIEFKRSFPDKSTDTIFRALIESNGDVGRAQVLLGNTEFVLQNGQPLPSSVRSLFAPAIGPFDQQSAKYDLAFMRTLLHSTSKFSKKKSSSEPGQEGGRGVEFIRSLRNKHVQQKKQELMDNFIRVVEKTYFYGQNAEKKTWKPPKQVSKSSRPFS